MLLGVLIALFFIGRNILNENANQVARELDPVLEPELGCGAPQRRQLRPVPDHEPVDVVHPLHGFEHIGVALSRDHVCDGVPPIGASAKSGDPAGGPSASPRPSAGRRIVRVLHR